MGIKFPNLAEALGVDEGQVIPQLQAIQNSNHEVATAIGAQYTDLSGPAGSPTLELINLARSFERQFVLPFTYRDVLLKALVSRIGDALLGAMIAKYQFNKTFGGETPGSGQFGMTPIRAAWLGVGNDWDAFPALTAAVMNNWIHAGTTYMGGTAGNDVRVGSNGVHALIGFIETAPSPKAEAIEIRLDGAILPVYVIGFDQKLLPTSQNIMAKLLDNTIFLKKGSTFRSRIWTNDAGTSIPIALGFSFVTEDIMRNFVNPANLPGTTQDFILTT